MKKLLIVSDYIDKIGWIETYIANLKNILKEDFKISYFWAKRLNRFKIYFYLLLSFLNFPFAKKFQKKIDEFKPDIIRFHSVSRFLWASVLKKIENFSWIKIMTYHDLWYFSLFADSVRTEDQVAESFSFKEFFSKSGALKRFLPYSILKYRKLKKIRNILSKNIDFHTVPSDFMRKYVIRLWYWSEDNTDILPNFVRKEQITSRLDKFQDKINFIFFWRIESWKWFWVLLYFLWELWNLKFKNKTKYDKISSKIRIFIFWDWSKKNDLLENFIWDDMYGQDISIVQDLQASSNIEKSIDLHDQKFVYYFGKRDFDEILNFLSFSHFELVPSLFLETFGLSALEWAVNWVLPVTFDKENIKNFALEKYIVWGSIEDYSSKIFDIIENFELSSRKSDSRKNLELVKKFVI